MQCHLVVSVCGAALVAGLAGCRDPDPRLGQLASQVTHEQAQHNQRIAEGSRAIAAGSQQLVAADAQARRELIDLQQGLRHDQTEVARQRHALGGGTAGNRARSPNGRGDPVQSGARGLILACLAPLVFAGLALLGLWREPTREEEGQILVEQLAQVWADTPAAQFPPPPTDPQPAGRLPRPQPRDPPRYGRLISRCLSNQHARHKECHVSHIVSIKTEVRDAAAVAAACRRLGLPPPEARTVRLFSGQATGLSVQLPGWNYPVVCNLASGQLQFDNHNGAWGEARELDKFLQAYACEKAKLAAHRQGYAVYEQSLPDGSVKLTIQVSGGAA